MNLLRTHSVFVAELDRTMKSFGLSRPLYNVLRILDGARQTEDNGALAAREIGARMIDRDPDVTRLVDRLETLGLARRQCCQRDRRVVWISVTQRGSELVAETKPVRKRMLNKMLGHMNSARLGQLSDCLAVARQPHI